MIFGDRITGIICWTTGDCRQYREPPLSDTWGGKKASDVAWAKAPMGGCRMGENIDVREC